MLNHQSTRGLILFLLLLFVSGCVTNSPPFEGDQSPPVTPVTPTADLPEEALTPTAVPDPIETATTQATVVPPTATPLSSEPVITQNPIEPTDEGATATPIVDPPQEATVTPPPSSAQPSPVRIMFEPGAVSGVVNDFVTHSESDSYVFRAEAGQKVSIAIVSAGGTAGFNLAGVNDGSPLKRLENEMSIWQDTVRTTQDYQLNVVTPHESVAYELSLTILPPAGERPTPNYRFLSELLLDLTIGLREQDYSSLRPLLKDTFHSIQYRSEGAVIPADQALSGMTGLFGSSGNFYLAPSNGLEQQGFDLFAPWGPEAGVVKGLYAVGLGDSGEDEAILAISLNEDRYYWHGMYFATFGFE